MYSSSSIVVFDCDKVTAFFSLAQHLVKISFSGILSICSVQGCCCDIIRAGNRGFDDRMLITRHFCGKSFFRLFLLFSQSMKKN